MPRKEPSAKRRRRPARECGRPVTRWRRQKARGLTFDPRAIGQRAAGAADSSAVWSAGRTPETRRRRWTRLDAGCVSGVSGGRLSHVCWMSPVQPVCPNLSWRVSRWCVKVSESMCQRWLCRSLRTTSPKSGLVPVSFQSACHLCSRFSRGEFGSAMSAVTAPRPCVGPPVTLGHQRRSRPNRALRCRICLAIVAPL